jgi:hypothetical protein
MKQRARLLKAVHWTESFRVKVSDSRPPGSNVEIFACPPFQTSCGSWDPNLNCTFLEERSLLGYNKSDVSQEHISPSSGRNRYVPATRRYKPEDRNRRSHRCENLKSSTHAPLLGIINGGELEIPSRGCCHASVERRKTRQRPAANTTESCSNADLGSNPAKPQTF